MHSHKYKHTYTRAHTHLDTKAYKQPDNQTNTAGVHSGHGTNALALKVSRYSDHLLLLSYLCNFWHCEICSSLPKSLSESKALTTVGNLYSLALCQGDNLANIGLKTWLLCMVLWYGTLAEGTSLLTALR